MDAVPNQRFDKTPFVLRKGEIRVVPECTRTLQLQTSWRQALGKMDKNP